MQHPPPKAGDGGWVRPGFITTLPWKAVYNADPSAPSKWPSLNAELASALDAAHAFLYIKRPLLLHFSELAWWCHLLMTAASLSNLSPSALCSRLTLLLNPAGSTEQKAPRWLSLANLWAVTRLDCWNKVLQRCKLFQWTNMDGWGTLTNLSKSWPTMPASTWAVKFFSSIHRMRFWKWKQSRAGHKNILCEGFMPCSKKKSSFWVCLF